MKKQINWLVALNAIIIAFALLMFITGVAASALANKIQKTWDLNNSEKLELKLGEFVGKTYTEDIHKQLVKTLHSQASVGEKGIVAVCSYSGVMYQAGGAICLSAMVSLFILWRLKRLSTQPGVVP